MNTEIKIRKALLEDSEFLFNLRNEESVRKVSGNPNIIPWENHQAWFKKRLVNPKSIIFIIELEGQSIAQTRYDLGGNGTALDGSDAEVSIAVAKDFRGKGLGTEILKKTAEKFWETFPEIKTIRAFINLGNEASVRSFSKAGYRLIGQSNHNGLVQNEMILLK